MTTKRNDTINLNKSTTLSLFKNYLEDGFGVFCSSHTLSQTYNRFITSNGMLVHQKRGTCFLLICCCCLDACGVGTTIVASLSSVDDADDADVDADTKDWNIGVGDDSVLLDDDGDDDDDGEDDDPIVVLETVRVM